MKSQAELIEELKSKQVELTSALEDKQVQLEAAITDSKVQAAKELSETKVALEQAQDTAKVSLAQDLGDLTSRVHKGEELQVGLASNLEQFQESIAAKDAENAKIDILSREEFEQFHQSDLNQITAMGDAILDTKAAFNDSLTSFDSKFKTFEEHLSSFEASYDIKYKTFEVVDYFSSDELHRETI